MNTEREILRSELEEQQLSQEESVCVVSGTPLSPPSPRLVREEGETEKRERPKDTTRKGKGKGLVGLGRMEREKGTKSKQTHLKTYQSCVSFPFFGSKQNGGEVALFTDPDESLAWAVK